MADLRSSTGKLYGIGVGPGDPELLTLKAHRLIGEIPVIGVPFSRPGERSLALDIAGLRVDSGRQEVLRLLFPMSREGGELRVAWEAAAEAIAARLRAGRDCAFLTEGDPCLYSTFAYLLERLAGQIPYLAVEIVPGISSINASAARALRPLAMGDESVAIVTSSDLARIRTALRQHDCVVILKVKRHFDSLLEMLETEGLAERAFLVERATGEGERVVMDIRALRGRDLNYFSLVVVRKG